jgi:hypothetical protein
MSTITCTNPACTQNGVGKTFTPPAAVTTVLGRMEPPTLSVEWTCGTCTQPCEVTEES